MKNKWTIILGLLIAALAVYFFYLKPRQGGQKSETYTEISPVYGSIEKTISATAVVQPQNRLEMKPPVGGRVDKILVEEGQKVKSGEIVALMSSTDRAALLDAARSRGEKEMSYWQEVYKPIPLIAPIDGVVIVRTVQPGQTVTQSDAILVLSDRLIVQAQVDETDIGGVKEGQKAVITLDAYPEIKADATVSHIYHESKVVNIVTIYQVDIVPLEVPPVFRSGMSANARIIEEGKDNVLIIPLEAVSRDREGSVVFLSQGKSSKPQRRRVELGISDEDNVEVISGIGEKDVLAIVVQKYVPSKGQKAATNPFVPSGPGGQRRNRESTPRQ